MIILLSLRGGRINNHRLCQSYISILKNKKKKQIHIDALTQLVVSPGDGADWPRLSLRRNWSRIVERMILADDA